ncbi:MAG: YCF48-related protein [Ignavibacteria bacterium]|nr:YCF48-related protein [Ignavibacteria bacterium]
MKKFYTLSILFISLFLVNINLTFSQAAWQIVGIGTYENLNSISFPNPYTGYAAGNNSKLYKSTNAGLNWTALTSPATGNNYFVYFVDPSVGFVSNQTGFFKTTNGGGSWAQITLPSAYNVTSVQFSSASTGWLGNYYGEIMKTSDGGNTWATVYTMQGYNSKVFFINDLNGWAVDTYGYVVNTANGGTSFASQRILTDTLSDVKFITSSIGMIAADSGRVFKTINGGSSWTLINTGYDNKLTGIYVQSPSVAFASAFNGRIITSYNGGGSWINDDISANDLYQITFASGTSAGWVVGELGTIAKRVNAESMTCIGTGSVSIGYPFYSYYDDSRTDLLYTASEITNGGGGMGAITQIGFYFDTVRTQPLNGFTIKMQNTSMTSLTDFTSTNWTTCYSGTYVPSGLGLQFILLNNPFVYTAGSNLLIEVCYNNNSYTLNSYVLGTNAPGKTFHNHLDLPTGDGCTDITTGSLQTVRPNICFVSNVITNNGGSQNGVPSAYKLHQNFPNPFNPVTKIKFEVPKSTFVTLKVYDILGREVSVLVNENKLPGAYTVDFNASSLTSGVYFYRLETASFTDVKRMILVK